MNGPATPSSFLLILPLHMKTKLLALLLLAAGTVGPLSAADDPFAAIRTALDKNEIEAADTALAPLVATEKPDARAWLYLSQVRLRQKRTKDAVAAAEKAVAADPASAECHSNLGVVISQRMGEVNFMQQAMLAGKMLDAFKKSVALDPEHLDGYIGLTRYYTNAPAIGGGGREPAERYAHEVEKRNHALGTLELARIAERFEDYPKALELFTQVATAQPDKAWVQEKLGRICEKLKQPTEARAHYEKSLALDPARASAKEALEKLAATKG